MRYLFVFNFPPMKEGIIGLSIRYSTMIIILLFIIIKSVFILLLLSSYKNVHKYTTIQKFLYFNAFIIENINVFSLSLFYVNIFNRRCKILIIISNIINSICIWLYCIILIIFMFYLINESLEKNESFDLMIMKVFLIIDICIYCFTIFMIDFFLYFPIWSYYFHTMKRNFEIVNRTYLENRQYMGLSCE
jgi:hypothetical protein